MTVFLAKRYTNWGWTHRAGLSVTHQVNGWTLQLGWLRVVIKRRRA